MESQLSGLRPNAFALLNKWRPECTAVRRTAQELGIPCFELKEEMFSDPYAVTRTLSRLMASTPVSTDVAGRSAQRVARVSLVEKILKTEKLQKPVWA